MPSRLRTKTTPLTERQLSPVSLFNKAIDKKRRGDLTRPRVEWKSWQIQFDNLPNLAHVAPGDRFQALRAYRDWQECLDAMPVSELHWQLTGGFPDGFQRTTCASLIAKFYNNQKLTYALLFDDLTASAGEAILSTPGLITNQKNGGYATVNLLTLTDEVLWKLYINAPAHLRQAERPVRPKEERAPKERKPRKGQGTKLKFKRGKSGDFTAQVTYEQAVWACCDQCEKWRRIFGTTEGEGLPAKWYCSMHPDGDITCETPEEAMDAEEKWDGEVAEVQSPQSAESSMPPSALPSTHPSTVPSPRPVEGGADDDDAEVDNDQLFGSDWESD